MFACVYSHANVLRSWEGITHEIVQPLIISSMVCFLFYSGCEGSEDVLCTGHAAEQVTEESAILQQSVTRIQLTLTLLLFLV